MPLLARRRKEFISLKIVHLEKKELKVAKIKMLDFTVSLNGAVAKPHCTYEGSILRSFASIHASLLNLQQGAMVSTRNGETDATEVDFGVYIHWLSDMANSCENFPKLWISTRSLL